MKRVQNLSEAKKRRRIVWVSAVLCGLFLLVWMKYFGAITAVPEVPEASASVPEGVSFLDSLRAGLADVGHAVGGLFGSAASKPEAPESAGAEPSRLPALRSQ